ncbi:MAG: DUF4925 domain-containing protein [Bacteroides sp.]|nr:DUF4925 domain-containing protein [Bacteroides sp.]
MKRFSFLFAFVLALMLTGCDGDSPGIRFFSKSGTYTIGGDKELNVTFDGVKITEKNGKVIFESPDNKVATITISDIIPGYGEVTIAGLQITETPDGDGIAFAGEAALSQTEKIVFSGTIINFVMTIDINKVPVTQQP